MIDKLGRYRIIDRLGDGAMADVYRASDPDIGRPVAIKVLKPEFARDPDIGARFLREARAAGALSHPHIATIYDVGETAGTAYIAMELIDGQPLDELLQKQGRMPYERVLMIGRQLAAALAYAHRAGVVHRDIKPSNIMLCADGQTVKLLDFGVARIGESDGAHADKLAGTQVGQWVGTPRYMSPEQTLGLPVDHRSDLFSLGVVLYETVTGKVAFPGAGLATLAIQIAQERVEPIDRSVADCPPGLRFIIDKLLAKKPDQRFADGSALEAALAREIAAIAEPAITRRGLSLRVRLALLLSLVTALTLGLCVNSTLSRDRQSLEHMAVTSGDSIAAFVTNNAAVTAADNAGLPAGQQDWSALEAFASSASRDPRIRDLILVDAQGMIRAAGDSRLVGRRYRNGSETVVARENGTVVTEAEDTGHGAGLRFIRPIRYAGRTFGKVDLVMRRTELDQAIANAENALIGLSAIVMLVVLAMGYVSGAMVARPLTRLCAALQEAASNGFAVRISHRRRDEFGAAFDAFNSAAAQIEARLAPGERLVPATDLTATRVAPRAAA